MKNSPYTLKILFLSASLFAFSPPTIHPANAHTTREECNKECDDKYPYSSGESNINKENRKNCKVDCKEQYKKYKVGKPNQKLLGVDFLKSRKKAVVLDRMDQ